LKKFKCFFDFIQKKENVNNILVVRNGLVGDVTFCTVVINRLVNSFPDASIDVVVGKNSLSLLREFPNVRNLYAFDFNMNFKLFFRQLDFFRKLKDNKYDIAVIVEANPHFTFLTKFSGAKYLVGYKNSFSFLLDYWIEYPKCHAVNAHLETVKDWTEKRGDDRTVLYVSDEEISKMKIFLNKNGISENDNIILLNPGGSSIESPKNWVTERYAELSDALFERYNAKIIFNGLPGENHVLEKTEKLLKYKALFLTNEKTLSLRSLMALIKSSKLVIGIDTGTLHIANALNIPVLMLMGHRDPADTSPFDVSGKSSYILADMPCAPCYLTEPKPKLWKQFCKTQRPVKCMEKITTQMVMNEVEKIINR
jgi:ADP-heptose:LPS heptosyltransferase